MDQPAVTSLAQRLERFRAIARPAPHFSAVAATAGHLQLLADELGGRVDGDIVTVESHFELDVDRPALARLPFGVPSGPPLVALDTETTGLATAAGTVCFLVGVGSLVGGRLTVRQFLLPDHAVEAGFLTALADVIPPEAWLVTYNGKSFDWPLLVARYRMHRRDPPPTAGHLDLLHVARRIWKHRLGSARLATVEQAICRVRRTDDLPGALIPDRYFRYLRERCPELVRPIVEHNRQDVVSLVLLLRALGRLAQPESWRVTHPGDIGALGRAYARNGDSESALACLEAALGAHGWDPGTLGAPGAAPLWRRLATDRARTLARLGRRDDAVAAWLDVARRGGPGAAAAWLQVARHRERTERDPGAALDACVQALGAVERSRLWGRPVPAIERDLAVRMARLRRRVMASAISRAA